MNDFPEWEAGELPEDENVLRPSAEELPPAQEAPDGIPEETEQEMPSEILPEDALPYESESEIAQDDPAFYGDAESFDELYNASADTDSQIPEPRPVQKGRPRRRKGEGLWGIPNILVTFVWIGLVLLIGVTAGRMLWIAASEVLAFGREDKPVTVTIYEEDDIDTITEKLYNSNLIRYPGLFKLYAKFAVDDGEIHAGIWDLNTLYDYHALVRGMSPSSTRSVVKILIPEGYTCRQIFNLLEASKVCTVQDMEKYILEGDFPEYWFLNPNMERHKYCLEGYLFPDTYEFYQNDTPENIIGRMLANFNNRFDDDLRAEISNINERFTMTMKNSGHDKDYIAQRQLGIAEIITIASMIEKETANPTEGYTVSSVIYNRLYNWGATPQYLNIDAALVYYLEGKNPLTAEDLQLDTPYNTYKYTGLTPGPIANPGLNSIKAALYPNNTNYYYYVLDPTVGEHHFSRTLEEHNAFRARLG